MLRDVLSSINGVGTWPCDEINYIWRHGNVREESDEFIAEMASPTVVRYIRNEMNQLAISRNLDYVVEKTCANSLRIGFVDKILPDAHYIFIVRNGLDVVASANLRWKAKLDIPYLIKKIRYVPLLDLPYYAARYFWNRVYRLISGKNRLAFWGPQLNDMQRLLETHSLNEICAIQWQRCVQKSESELQSMVTSRVTRVTYENFVHDPEAELQRIIEEVGITCVSKSVITNAVENVSSKSIDKWQKQLSQDELKRLLPLVSETMKNYGYASEKL